MRFFCFNRGGQNDSSPDVYILDNVKTSLTMTTTDYIGAIGVSLILLAFFLNLCKVVDTQNMLYLALNFVGAGLACSASMMMQYVPFIVLEGTWMMMTGFALLRRYAQWRVQVRNTLQGQLA